MQVTHSGVTYECEVAVLCEDDKYIKLYDANGAEIASFSGITDFDEYTTSGGDFVAPCDCHVPIPLTMYSIGGRTIAPENWNLADDGKYYYEIASALISANLTTCNIMLNFASGTNFAYTATQESGKIVLCVDAIPENNIVIDSIHITRT